MIQTVKMNLDDGKELAILSKALSVETRIEMLKQLRHKDLNINELAEALSIPASSAAAHVKVLEEAGLIKSELQPGVRGSMKVCTIAIDHIYVEVNTQEVSGQEMETIRMPIGSYVDYKVTPTCGIVGGKGPIGEEDEPRSFYLPERLEAKLLWFGEGYVEYRFPNHFLKERKEKQIEISAEICSEDHEYNLDYPSDITLWVNGEESGTWTSPSDFGGRRGTQNPDWWPDKNTQYGILKTWKINKKGTYLDEEKISEKKIEAYHLYEKEYISVRIGIKEDAKNKGGVNLFGEGFGDYAQNIVMRISFDT
ncbi:MAG: helix-turn-helix domain-containing protein [Acetivibrio sp.]